MNVLTYGPCLLKKLDVLKINCIRSLTYFTVRCFRLVEGIGFCFFVTDAENNLTLFLKVISILLFLIVIFKTQFWTLIII